jgi:hypothetical protein
MHCGATVRPDRQLHRGRRLRGDSERDELWLGSQLQRWELHVHALRTGIGGVGVVLRPVSKDEV